MSHDMQVPALLMIIISILFPATGVSAARPPVQTAVQWEPHEIRLAAGGEHPWWEFPVTVDFTHQPTGKRLDLEAYWDGGRE